MLNVTSNTANAFIDSGEFCIPVGTRFSAGKSSVPYLCFRPTRERDRIRPPSPKLILLYSINFRSCISEKRGIGYPWLYYITLGGIWHFFLCGITLKKKFQFLEPSLKDAGHLRSTGDAPLLKGLFALCAAPMITVMVSRRREERINIRLDRLNFLCFFFELHTFIIEPLLLFKKSLLFRLQRLQARQFFIALHSK